MKKISLIAVLALVASVTFGQRTQFGIKAGWNSAHIRDENAPGGTDSRSGFHVGALAHIHLSPALALQPEVVYSAEGADYNYQGWVGEDEIDYINIPVNLQYMYKGFRLQTGPQLGILTSAELETETTDRNINNINNVNFSWSFGAGYKLPMGLGIDARYNHGISNMYEKAPLDAKSRVWQVGLFYQLGK